MYRNILVAYDGSEGADAALARAAQLAQSSRSRVARFMLGNTSSTLAANAHCDVLVVPPGER